MNSTKNNIEKVSICNLGRIYYILHFLKKIGMAEIVNDCLPNSSYNVEIPGKGLVNFTVGQLFEIMVINRLYGFNTPLYHISEWCANTSIPEIYGIPAKLLNDDRIGRMLEKIYPHLAIIDSRITIAIIKAFSLDVDQIHFDPSSFKVCGEYLPIAGEDNAVQPTYGRDGKGKVDEKQVRFGVAITADGGVPLMAKEYSGNVNDSEMHPEFLIELRKTLGRNDFLFVADTKLDTKENLSDIFLHKGFFLCPGVFSPQLKDYFIERYSQECRFERIEYVSQRERKKPIGKRNYFEAFEKKEKIEVKTQEGQTKTYEYRLIFVYSSMKAKSERNSRKKGIAKVQLELDWLSSRLNKKGAKTREEIMAKLSKILNRPTCKKIFEVHLNETNGIFSLSYEIDNNAMEREQKLDGIYVLKTNLPESYSLNEVLSIYKKQGRIESRIADIKGPLQVAPIFLDNPDRTESLFTIILQALKVYTLIEREVHQAVKEEGKPIPILPENRNSERPKGSTILRLFDDHSIALVTITFDDGSSKIHLSALSEKQKMLFNFIKRKPPDRRNFSRKIGIYIKRFIESESSEQPISDCKL